MTRPSLARSSVLGRWPLKASVVIVTSAGAILILYGLVVGFVIKPPLLGWVGFAIMSMVVLILSALAPLAFERTRVSALRPADPVDQEKRLLVVVDSQCNASALCDEILASHGDAVATHVVVPVRVSHLHFVTDDENHEWHEAQQSPLQMVGVLQQRAAAAAGSVGSDKPLESMTDALGFFPATHVLLATPPEEESYWLERDLLKKARSLTRASVTQVVVPATPARVRTAWMPSGNADSLQADGQREFGPGSQWEHRLGPHLQGRRRDARTAPADGYRPDCLGVPRHARSRSSNVAQGSQAEARGPGAGGICRLERGARRLEISVDGRGASRQGWIRPRRIA